MKLTDLALIFLILEIILFGILDIRYNQLKAVSASKNAYNTALDNAVDDSCYFLVEEDSGRNLYTNKDRAVEEFFLSLFANFGVMGQAVSEKKLQSYVPIVLVTDRDGFYINYSDVLVQEESIIIRRWTEKIPYTYEDEKLVCCFTLGSFLRIYNKESKENLEGDYGDIRAFLPDSPLREEENFDTIRRNSIINVLKENMNIYINYYNSIAAQFGITYEFWLPEVSRTDWYRTIDDVSVFVIFQGYPYRGSSLDTYNRYAFGGARIKKSNSFYIQEKEGKKYYHRDGCRLLTQAREEAFYSKKECAEEGAFPCPECIP